MKQNSTGLIASAPGVITGPKTNGSVYLVPLGEEFENDDASWIMACTFLIYTMQTGIGLIESGFCSMKNEVHVCSFDSLCRSNVCCNRIK